MILDRIPDGFTERSTVLFFLASIPVTVFMVNTGLQTFTGTYYPEIQSFVGPAGFLLGVVALVSLAPTMASGARKLATAGAAVAVVPLVGWVGILLHSVGQATGMIPESASVGPLAIPVIITMLLSFGLLGAASLRAGVHSPVIGILLLGEAAMYGLLITRIGTPFIIDVGHTVAYLGVAVTLWTEDGVHGPTEAAADSTA